MTPDQPRVAVVIACRDAAAHLADQLEAIATQQDDVALEVVVVDDASSDDSSEVARRQAGAFRRLEVLRLDRQHWVGPARNRGVERTTAPLLLFVDADDVVQPGYVAAMVDALARTPMVGSRIDDTLQNPPWARQGDALYQRDGLQRWADSGFVHVGGGTIGITRELFDALGGFTTDERLRFAEAADICLRAQLAGHDLAFVPDAVVQIRQRSTLGGTYRQARGWGESSVAVEVAHHGSVPVADWRRGLLGWMLLPVRLLAVRDRRDLAGWLHLAGWKVGRLRASLRHRRPAL